MNFKPLPEMTFAEIQIYFFCKLIVSQLCVGISFVEVILKIGSGFLCDLEIPF